MTNYAVYDKVHNQSIEINELRAELARAKKAYDRLQASRNAERKAHQEQMTKEQKMTAFYKGKFILLAFGKKAN